MNIYLLISAVLLALTSVAHSLFGEMAIIGPLQKASDLPAVLGSIRFTKMTLRFTWHVTSVLGMGLSAILYYYARHEGNISDRLLILQILSLTFFAAFLVSIVGSRMKHPAWIVFLITAVLTWIGCCR